MNSVSPESTEGLGFFPIRCCSDYEMIYLWLQAKAVNSIVRHVAEILGYKTDQELEDLYRSVVDFFLILLFMENNSIRKRRGNLAGGNAVISGVFLACRYDADSHRGNPVFRILPLFSVAFKMTTKTKVFFSFQFCCSLLTLCIFTLHDQF